MKICLCPGLKKIPEFLGSIPLDGWPWTPNIWLWIFSDCIYAKSKLLVSFCINRSMKYYKDLVSILTFHENNPVSRSEENPEISEVSPVGGWPWTPNIGLWIFFDCIHTKSKLFMSFCINRSMKYYKELVSISVFHENIPVSRSEENPENSWAQKFQDFFQTWTHGYFHEKLK